jgi:AcrR family transcriptional regulator
MARPITISNQQIIDATRALVTERGMLATSQQIALRANVSEGTIFKRFRTKTELFQTALGVQARELCAPFEALEHAGSGSTITSLRVAGCALIELRLRAESLAGSPRVTLSLGDTATKHRIIELVRSFIEAEAALHHSGPLGARAMAVAFVSALFGLELSDGFERDLDQIMTLIFRDLAVA